VEGEGRTTFLMANRKLAFQGTYTPRGKGENRERRSEFLKVQGSKKITSRPFRGEGVLPSPRKKG